MAIAESSLDENILALLCIVVISVLGLVGNGLSLHITITNSNFRNAYGTLRTAVLLCNVQTISIIMIWGAIVLLTNSRELSSPTSFIALIPGCLANVSLYGSVLLNLLISVNRYCAFAFPLKYHNFWSIARVRKAVIIVYFLGFLPCFPSLFEPCTLIFNTELDFRWSYCNTACGYINSMFDTATVSSILIIGGCVDLVTLLKIRKFMQIKQSVTSSIKRKHEIFIFKQSCISEITMIISALVFNIGQQVLTNKWALFAVSTIGWEMAHVLDG
uniref:G_PROTEIN_RECEP_F1_2 domain-containing protein n=1 Tax=Onchocerca volvulus TaxID=6282 RepID=A0A8R1XPT7_ONCVO